MKARLMFDDSDFAPDAALLEAVDHPYRHAETATPEPPIGQRDMIADLELEQLWAAMANGDPIVYASARTAMLAGLTTVAQIRYRQEVLADCLAQPDTAREIYALAVDAIAQERKIWGGMFGNHADMLLHRSVTVLETFVPILKKLRALADEPAEKFSSKAFVRFFDTLRRELDDDYFDEIDQHLHHLRFSHGVLMSAALGEFSQGIDYVLRTPRPDRPSRFLFRRPVLPKPTFTYTLPPRDEAGGQALGRLRDRGLTLVANTLKRSTDHILGFFTALRSETAFYIGCLNLRDELERRSERLCMPDPRPVGSQVRTAFALYDPCLALRLDTPVASNDLHADGKSLVLITGANQGGKSTFLRSFGVAQLMMQAGMFTAASSFTASIVTGVFTHYKREEDATMTSGKFDEELGRMGRIATVLRRGAVILCNESFAATNEREGSEIAYEFTRAMRHIGITVIYVTHLYDLSQRYEQHHASTTLFLRAQRNDDGRRTFRLDEAPPLPTSFGEDLYWRTFPEDRPERSTAPTVAASERPTAAR